MKIMYLPSDMDAPGFYRCLSPALQLKDHGHDVMMPPFDIKARGDRYHIDFKVNFTLPRSADLYVLQQRKERDWHEEGLPKVRSLGMATTMDVDDNYVNVPAYNPAFYGTHEYRRDDGVIVNRKMRRNVARQQGFKPPINKNNKTHMVQNVASVDLVTVSTPFLANAYEPFNKNIKVIRNYLDWEIWNDVQPQYEVERERIRIGYLAVFSYRAADLKVLGHAVRRFLRAHPEVDFVANSVGTHRALGVPEGQQITVGEYDFQPIVPAHCITDPREEVAATLAGELPVGRMTAVCDIGLVPLAPNDLNQGKSHLKGMEYNAAGIPYIASPTESYKDYWHKQGESSGMLAWSESDWYSMMEYLVENEHIRRKLGQSGRAKARQHSIQENWREWESAYADLVGGEHKKVARKSIQWGGIQKTSELGPFLEEVEALKPKVVVEIGTAAGGTFWAISQYATDDALMISIDIPGGSPLDVRNGKDVYIGRDRDRIQRLIKETQRLRLIDINSQTQAAYATLVQALGGEQIDLLFIDGDHRYEGVKHDYETYSPLVRPGGLVAFHDIVTHQDKRVGVHVLWEEIKQVAPFREFVGPESWGFTPWGGIGVVYVH